MSTQRNILQQGNYILQQNGYVFETGGILAKSVCEIDPAQITGKINNDPIAAIKDSSGNGNDLRQETATLQPLYKTNEINGQPAIVFDGVNDFMQFTYGIDALTTFFVLAMNAGNINAFYGTAGTALNHYTSGTANWFRASGDVPNTLGHYTLYSPPLARLYVNNSASLTAAQAPRTAFYILLCVDNATPVNIINFMGASPHANQYSALKLAYFQAYNARMSYGERDLRSRQIMQRFNLGL